MIRTRHISLAFAVFVLLSFTVATGAFSSATVERGVEIGVVNDEKASLAIDLNDTVNVTSGNTTTFLSLMNQFGMGTTLTNIIVDATERSHHMSVSITEIPDTLANGESAPVKLTVNCSAPVDTVPVVVHITVSGSDVAVSLNRPINVSCISATNTTSNEMNVAANMVNATGNETAAIDIVQ